MVDCGIQVKYYKLIRLRHLRIVRFLLNELIWTANGYIQYQLPTCTQIGRCI
jgi:hypothetical protein